MNEVRAPAAVALAAGARSAASTTLDDFGDPAPRLAAAFEFIARARMAGVPILNDALRVQAVGFRRWDAFWLGVLVTPWCMNLMLLPADAACWPRLRVGEKRKYVFPAGVFEFIAGCEALLAGDSGRPLGDAYLMCSLFSPVFDFADHGAAVATAAACLDALFDEANFEATEMSVTRAPASIAADAAAAAERAERVQADAAQAMAGAAEGDGAGAGADAGPAAGAASGRSDPDASKRDFLRGRWSPR